MKVNANNYKNSIMNKTKIKFQNKKNNIMIKIKIKLVKEKKKKENVIFVVQL